MPAPASAPAEVGDNVPLPVAADVRPGTGADELLAASSGDPFFLGFAGGRYYPSADEHLDPELVAAAAQARLDGRSEVCGFVMFAKRMTPERGAELERLGVRVLRFHPHCCLEVALPVDGLDAIAALEFVRWVGVARTTQKLHPALAELEPERDGRLALYVSVFESDLGPQSTWEPAASAWRTDGGVASELNDVAILPRRWTSRGPAQRALEALGVEVREYVDDVQAFRVFTLPQQVEALASLDRVQFVEPDFPPRPLHDESTPMIGADATRLCFSPARAVERSRARARSRGRCSIPRRRSTTPRSSSSPARSPGASRATCDGAGSCRARVRTLMRPSSTSRSSPGSVLRRSKAARRSRHGARPPIATERLSLAPDGRVVHRLERHWRDGTSAVSFDPLTFIERLASLVPRPRCHLLTYPSATRRATGAELLQRVFAIDVLTCPHCGGRRKLIALITQRAVVRKILTHLGLPTEPPALAPARAPPETDFAFDA